MVEKLEEYKMNAMILNKIANKLQCALVSLVMTTAFTLFAQTSDDAIIPDRHLQDVIRNALGKFGEPIKLSELSQLRSIEAFDNQIATLEGLQHATNLINLAIARTGTTNFEAIRSLEKLKSLTLQSEELEDISFLGELSLESLNIAFNRVRDISPISKMQSLRSLQALGNRITNLWRLETLSLINLTAGESPISNIESISKLHALETLSLANSGIESISALTNFPSLRELFIDGNSFPQSEIGVITNLHDLTVLGIYNCGLNDISFLRSCPQLRVLSIGANPISDLTPISDLIRLTWLTIPDMRLESLLFLRKLSRLETLDIGRSSVKNINLLTNNFGLVNLMAGDNVVVDFSALLKMPRLKSVDIGRNSAIAVPGSLNGRVIAKLKANGVAVNYLPQYVTDFWVGYDPSTGEVHVQGPVGAAGIVQRLDSFADGIWTNVSSVNLINGYGIVSDPSESSSRFYQFKKQ